jgi:RNA polymerase sigma factor (sigma-70 family)
LNSSENGNGAHLVSCRAIRIAEKLVNRAVGHYHLQSMIPSHELVEQHLGLAQVIALDYCNIPGIALDEAVSEANLAMFRASEGFDPRKGDFAPYAARAIRNSLNSLYAKQLKIARMFPKSLDEPPVQQNGPSDSSSNSEPARAKDSRQDVHKSVKRGETFSILADVLKTLSPREQIVIEHMRLGRSLSEIGDTLGVSKQAIHKISAPALSKLRARLEETGYQGLDSQGFLKSWPKRATGTRG